MRYFFDIVTWELRKLGEVSDIVRGSSPRPISDSKWFDTNSKVGWLRISDVTSQQGRIKKLDQHLSKLGEEKTRVLLSPHLLLSIAASVGYPVINYVPTGVHDGFLIFKNPKFQLNYGFYWLQNNKNKWQKYGQPGSQVNLNSSIVENAKIFLPNNNEQSKIIALLLRIDKMLALQQRKLKELQQVKQTLSQFLLNGNTHTPPTLRFNGFEDIWKENKLKDIAKISMGQSPSSNNYNKKGNGKILIQGNADIDNGGIRPRVWTTEITKLANKNDILLTVRAPVGELAITNREVVIGRGIAAIKGNKFIYNLLVQKNKEHFWDRISSGSTFKSISSNDIKQLKVYIPSEKEETLIASILVTIKNKIDFQNERINVINKLKKYLLTNLFI